MAPDLNVFRVCGDLSHFLSILILIWSFRVNRSAEGVSLLTQALYVVVFCARYVDIFMYAPSASYYQFFAKLFLTLSSLLVVVLMMSVYARSREREKAWKLAFSCVVGSALLAPVITLIYYDYHFSDWVEVLYTFSLILESVCVLPQLLLLRQTNVPTVIDSYYLLTLGSYRAFYILNWILRATRPGHTRPSGIAVLFGIVQTALYLDFGWVYWSRQRVKLRAGGVVDSDDYSRGWLVGRILGAKNFSAEDDEVVDAENALNDDDADDDDGDAGDGAAGPGHAAKARQSSHRWGPRGISVSADDPLLDAITPLSTPKIDGDRSADGLVDPRSFEDDELANDAPDIADSNHPQALGQALSDGGAEWREPP